MNCIQYISIISRVDPKNDNRVDHCLVCISRVVPKEKQTCIFQKDYYSYNEEYFYGVIATKKVGTTLCYQQLFSVYLYQLYCYNLFEVEFECCISNSVSKCFEFQNCLY